MMQQTTSGERDEFGKHFMKKIRSEIASMGESHPLPATGKVANCLNKGSYYFDISTDFSIWTILCLSFCYSDYLNNHILNQCQFFHQRFIEHRRHLNIHCYQVFPPSVK